MTAPKKPSWTYQRRVGGLMRCCLLSLDEAMEEYARKHDEPPPEGYVVECRYGGRFPTKMVMRDGAFEWDRSSAYRSGE